ncbi:hypothetical protein ACWGQ6_38315, partial [Streptomyces niveus]
MRSANGSDPQCITPGSQQLFTQQALDGRFHQVTSQRVMLVGESRQVSPDLLDGWVLALGQQLIGGGVNTRFGNAAGHEMSPV